VYFKEGLVIIQGHDLALERVQGVGLAVQGDPTILKVPNVEITICFEEMEKRKDQRH